MKRISRREYLNTDRTLSGQLKDEIESIDVPQGEYERILKAALSDSGPKQNPEPDKKSWTPKRTPLPLRFTAAAAFMAGVIYISVFAAFGNDFTWKPGSPGTGQGFLIEKESLSDLKDSAGQFLWRVARSMNINLNESDF